MLDYPGVDCARSFNFPDHNQLLAGYAVLVINCAVGIIGRRERTTHLRRLFWRTEHDIVTDLAEYDVIRSRDLVAPALRSLLDIDIGKSLLHDLFNAVTRQVRMKQGLETTWAADLVPGDGTRRRGTERCVNRERRLLVAIVLRGRCLLVAIVRRERCLLVSHRHQIVQRRVF